LDRRFEVEAFRGSQDPIRGWVSRGYHRKEASTTLIGRCVSEGSTSLACTIHIGKAK
jgi:hypothetical protein